MRESHAPGKAARDRERHQNAAVVVGRRGAMIELFGVLLGIGAGRPGPDREIVHQLRRCWARACCQTGSTDRKQNKETRYKTHRKTHGPLPPTKQMTLQGNLAGDAKASAPTNAIIDR